MRCSSVQPTDVEDRLDVYIDELLGLFPLGLIRAIRSAPVISGTLRKTGGPGLESDLDSTDGGSTVSRQGAKDISRVFLLCLGRNGARRVPAFKPGRGRLARDASPRETVPMPTLYGAYRSRATRKRIHLTRTINCSDMEIDIKRGVDAGAGFGTRPFVEGTDGK